MKLYWANLHNFTKEAVYIIFPLGETLSTRYTSKFHKCLSPTRSASASEEVFICPSPSGTTINARTPKYITAPFTRRSIAQPVLVRGSPTDGTVKTAFVKSVSASFHISSAAQLVKKACQRLENFFVAGSVLRVHVETASGGQSDGEDQQGKLHFPAIKIREICIIGESEQLVGQYCGGLPSSEGWFDTSVDDELWRCYI